jgi:hypothetical protein
MEYFIIVYNLVQYIFGGSYFSGIKLLNSPQIHGMTKPFYLSTVSPRATAPPTTN